MTTMIVCEGVFAAYPVSMAPPHSSTTGNGQNLAVAFAPSAFITGPTSGSHNGNAPTGSNNRDTSAQTSPIRSLGNNTDSPTDDVKRSVAGSAGGGSAVLDAIQAAVVAASSPRLETPKTMEAVEEITHQSHPVSSTSPPVRDTNNLSLVVTDDARSSTTTTSSSSTTVASPAVKPTAFAVEFDPETEKLAEDTTGLSINDSLSKFLPERLRVKQQQQQEEKARSREALARELKQQQQMSNKKGTPTRTSVKTTTGSSASKSVNTPKLQLKSTGSTGSGKKQPEQYTEHSLYKEAAEFDRKIAVDSSGIDADGYSDAVDMIADDIADKASECGTYTIALDDPANGANGNNDQQQQQQRKNSDDDPHSGQYPWQSVLDKFLASSTGANASVKFDDDATPSGSRSTSSSTTDGINNVNSGGANDISKLEAEIDQLAEERAMNISLQDVKNFPKQPQNQPKPTKYEGALSNGSSNGTPQPKTVAPKPTPLPSHHQQPVAQTTTVRQQPSNSTQKTYMSPPVSKGSEQKHRTLAAQFHMPPTPSQGPQASRRPYSTGVNVASSRYSPSLSSAVRSSTVKSQTSENSLANDSINTELLLQDTEQVVKTLTNRQAALERQQKLSPSIRQPEPHLSPRNAPERRSDRISSQRRQQITKVGSPSKRASSTSRNPSVGSNLDSAGSSSDVCGPARDRLYLRMTASSAARQSSAQQLRRDRDANVSVGSSSVISAATEPRVQSRQSLGQRIVLKSRDNAKLEQYRGAAAVSSIQQARSRQKAQAKLTAQEEQRARELEAWRRRKGYDPRKSVAEERAAKRSSRNSSLSRNSVESTEDSEYRIALLNNQHSSSRNQSRYENQHHQQLDDDNEQPREISLDDYPDDDEFILVYDDGEHDEDTLDSVTEVTPAPTSLPPAISTVATPATSYSQSPQLHRSTKLNTSRDQSLVDSVTTSCFETGSDTPRVGNKQYQQLKDGRRVMVFTDEAWCKPDCISPTVTSTANHGVIQSINGNGLAPLNGTYRKSIGHGSSPGTSQEKTITTAVITNPASSLGPVVPPIMSSPSKLMSASVAATASSPQSETAPSRIGVTAATNAASLERVDGLILSSVYRLAAKLTDRAASVVGKPAPTRQHQPPTLQQAKTTTLSTESQLVGTLTELHRLERLLDEISEVVSTTSMSSTSQQGSQMTASPSSSLYSSSSPANRSRFPHQQQQQNFHHH